MIKGIYKRLALIWGNEGRQRLNHETNENHIKILWKLREILLNEVCETAEIHT